MTAMQASGRPWTGQTGVITADQLSAAAGELRTPICYVAGPPGMVEATRQALNRAGFNDDDVRSEEFHGY